MITLHAVFADLDPHCSSVSFYTRVERYCGHITSTFLAEISGKEKRLLYSEGKRRAFCHLMADLLVSFRLLVLVVRDSIITLSAIAWIK